VTIWMKPLGYVQGSLFLSRNYVCFVDKARITFVWALTNIVKLEKVFFFVLFLFLPARLVNYFILDTCRSKPVKSSRMLSPSQCRDAQTGCWWKRGRSM